MRLLNSNWLDLKFGKWALFPIIFLALMACSAPLLAGNATLTATTGGGAISANTAGGTPWTTLAGPSLAEEAPSGIGKGSIVLNIPTGFEFNPGVTVTATVTGTGFPGSDLQLSSSTATVNASTITVTVSSGSTGQRKSTITWSGVQVRPTAGTCNASGCIYKSGTSTYSETGATLCSGTGAFNYGTLTEVTGAASKLAFVQQPSNTLVNATISPAVTVQATDSCGTSVSGALSMSVALTAPGGATLGGTLTRTSNASGLSTFNDLSVNLVGSYTLTASSSGLVSATSTSFTINNPVPTTTSISPSSKNVGDASFTMTVNGTNFVPASVVDFAGSARTTTYVSATQLTASIPASDLITAGTYSITVVNPSPGGGTSNAQTFTVVSGIASFDAVEVGAAKATNIYTKLAGTAFNLDVLALGTGGAMQTGYSGSPTVELVSVGAGACSGWTSLAGVTVTAGAAWSGGRRTYTFNSSRASANTRVRITDGSVVACSTDNFAIRPASFTVAITKSDGTALPNPIKAGLFDMKASVQTTVVGYAGTVGFYPSQSLDQNGLAVAGRGTLTLANAVNTQIIDVGATPATPIVDGEVFTTISSGVAGTLPENAAYGAPVSPVTGFRYHDAGNLNLAIRDKTFTAVDGVADCVAGSASNVLTSGKYGCDVGGDMTVSRFIPDHFTVSGSFAPACASGGFTYMDQQSLGIALTVSAMSAKEIVATLYGNACPAAGSCKVTLAAYNGTAALDIGRLKPLAGFPSGTSYDTTLTPKAYTSTAWINGQYTVSGTNFYVARDTAPDGVFDQYLLKVAITDPDSVTISGSGTTTATLIRYGRLWLANAYGSEKLNLLLSYQMQYWNGQTFVRNILDNCTALTAANFGLGNYQGVTSTTLPVTAVSLGAYSGGNGSIVLAAPNVAGSVDVVAKLGSSLSMCPGWTPTYPAGTPLVASYLQGKWCGTTYVKDPAVRATFGISGTSAKKGVIYLRESY